MQELEVAFVSSLMLANGLDGLGSLDAVALRLHPIQVKQPRFIVPCGKIDPKIILPQKTFLTSISPLCETSPAEESCESQKTNSSRRLFVSAR